MESQRAPSRPLDVVIGLGANLGHPRLTLGGAVSELASTAELSAVSSLYATLPVGGPPQPDYLNAAVRLRWGGTPPELLEQLLRIERALGRERRERWGPRTLDLDVLWIRDLAWSAPNLTVPHPRLRERAFALCPLLELVPDAVDPGDGSRYERVLEALGSAGVVSLGPSWV